MSLSEIDIAPDRTHHVRSGEPLYAERFDEVLSFHSPGLAAVRRGDAAWHIHLDGSPAYAHRFLRTFGFYERRAAVVTRDGWRYIDDAGHEASSGRFAWCGNFQGHRAAVRDNRGRYFHVDLDGSPAYAHRWAYAGDYRNGIAVVQAENGRSTHIDKTGSPTHHVWFLDLDVFHKGFARARDDDGWMHVDLHGRPAYSRRFASVEPFYNGQARVERFDGGLEVIDESGRTTVEVRTALTDEFHDLSRDMVSFWKTHTICAGVELGVFEQLPATTEEIAISLSLVPDRTARLLRALAEIRLVELRNDTWYPTARGHYLRIEHPSTLADAALEYARRFSPNWAHLSDAIRGDNWDPPPLFEQVARGDRALEHHRMLRSYALHDYASVPAAMSLSGDEMVIDAGGGLGVLTTALVKHYPSLRAFLLDRPEVIRQTVIPDEVADRVQCKAVDLFEPWQVAGDVVLMARVLHDWDDDVAKRLLCQARASLPQGGALFVVELVVPEDGYAGALCDLHLLMATGGRERTLPEFANLLESTGFALAAVRPLSSFQSLIVGVAR